MSKLWDGLAAIHDMSGFGHIGDRIPGIPYYADRALLLPVDIAVVMDDGEDLDGYLEYLRDVRIGPKRVLRVRGPKGEEHKLFKGLDASPAAMGILDSHLRHGGMIQVFCRSPGSEAFFERHLIDPRRIHSAPREIADLLNDKAKLREIASGCGLGHVILPHVASRDPQAVMAAAKAFLADPAKEFVVVKRTNLAGGDGFMRLGREMPKDEAEDRVREYLRRQSWNELVVTSHSELLRRSGEAVVIDRAEIRGIGRDIDDGCERIAAIIRPLLEGAEKEGGDKRHGYVLLRNPDVTGEAVVKFRYGEPLGERIRRFLLDQCRNEFLVEEGIEGDDFSTQIIVDDGGYRFLGPTKQIVDADGRHMGNVMVRAFDEALASRGLARLDKEMMESVSFDLAKWGHTRVTASYRGTIGFDFRIRRRDGRVFLLECNARQTASTYPLAVSAQLADGRFGESFSRAAPRRNWGIVMRNAMPTTARSWGALSGKLGGLLFDGRRGALPFNIRLMKLPDPQVGVVAVGSDLDEAYAISRLAGRKLRQNGETRP